MTKKTPLAALLLLAATHGAAAETTAGECRALITGLGTSREAITALYASEKSNEVFCAKPSKGREAFCEEFKQALQGEYSAKKYEERLLKNTETVRTACKKIGIQVP